MGGHLRVAREVGSYKVAGYTLKLVTLFFFSWLRRRKMKKGYALLRPDRQADLSLAKRKAPLRSFARCDARPRLRLWKPQAFKKA